MTQNAEYADKEFHSAIRTAIYEAVRYSDHPQAVSPVEDAVETIFEAARDWVSTLSHNPSSETP